MDHIAGGPEDHMAGGPENHMAGVANLIIKKNIGILWGFITQNYL